MYIIYIAEDFSLKLNSKGSYKKHYAAGIAGLLLRGFAPGLTN